MGEKLRRFFAGRYGMDALNRLLLVLSFLDIVALWFFPYRVFDFIFLLLMAVVYFRTFSRNIPMRYSENQKYLNATAGIRKRCRQLKTRFQQRKNYRFFKCPKCKQQVRVPIGKGKIEIRCPKCGERFIKKS